VGGQKGEMAIISVLSVLILQGASERQSKYMPLTTQPSSPVLSPVSSTHVFYLAAAAILLTIGSVVVVLFRKQRPSLAQYRITIAFLCFALSSVSALLFVAKVEITGNVGLFAITLAGPAVLWIAAIYILWKIWPEGPVILELSNVPATQNDGKWVSYEAWRFKLGALTYIFDGDHEESAVKDVLLSAYLRAPTKRKLPDAKIHTVFAYFRKTPDGGGAAADLGDAMEMVKLQRVSGSIDPPPADICHIAMASLPGGETSSYLFVKDGASHITHCDSGRRSGIHQWCTVKSPSVDCLILAHYPTGIPPVGDYLWIDVPKYSGEEAHVSVALIGTKAIETNDEGASRLWEVRPATASGGNDSGGDVPVSFRLLHKDGVVNRNKKSVAAIDGLADWLRCLDEVATGANKGHMGVSNDGRLFIQNVLGILRGGLNTQDGYTKILAAPHFPYAATFDHSGLTNPVVTSLQWK
jgi:hypothetical protein